MIRIAAVVVALVAAPFQSGAPVPSSTPTIGVVTSTANSGTGSLRAVLATCPDRVEFAYTDATIVVTAPLEVNCSRPISITGPAAGDAAIVAGSDGHTVGVGAIPLAPVARPGVTIINRGAGDGLVVRSSYVSVSQLAIRGTVTPGFADLAIRSTDNVSVNGVTLGLDANGLTAPPTSDRTGSELFHAQDSAGVRVTGIAAGWNVSYWGAVVFQNVNIGHLYRAQVVGASYGTMPVQTLDAVTLAYGTANFIVREVYVADTTSSSAIEMHQASHVTIDDSTLVREGRAGVTAYTATDITIARVVIDAAGTCGTPTDSGGVIVYGGSSKVDVSQSQIATVVCPPSRPPTFSVWPGSDGAFR